MTQESKRKYLIHPEWLKNPAVVVTGAKIEEPETSQQQLTNVPLDKDPNEPDANREMGIREAIRFLVIEQGYYIEIAMFLYNYAHIIYGPGERAIIGIKLSIRKGMIWLAEQQNLCRAR